jgi:hypothetical protein
MSKTEALKIALNLLESLKTGGENFRESSICMVCSIIEETLAEPPQEPVGVVYSMQDGYIGQMLVKDIPHQTKLYTQPD